VSQCGAPPPPPLFSHRSVGWRGSAELHARRHSAVGSTGDIGTRHALRRLKEVLFRATDTCRFVGGQNLPGGVLSLVVSGTRTVVVSVKIRGADIERAAQQTVCEGRGWIADLLALARKPLKGPAGPWRRRLLLLGMLRHGPIFLGDGRQFHTPGRSNRVG